MFRRAIWSGSLIGKPRTSPCAEGKPVRNSDPTVDEVVTGAASLLVTGVLARLATGTSSMPRGQGG
jgi:hypothetical protein